MIRSPSEINDQTDENKTGDHRNWTKLKNTAYESKLRDLRLIMAKVNSAKDSSENPDLKTKRYVTLTFTEAFGTQEVNANHEKDHNRDIDR